MMVSALIKKLSALPPNIPVLVEEQIDFFPVDVEIIGEPERAQFVLLHAKHDKKRAPRTTVPEIAR